MNFEKKLNLYNQGIDSITKIEDKKSLSAIQQIQLKAYKQNKPLVNTEKINTFINNVKYPISYFDFETFTDAVPIYNGQSPHMKMPFQYSLHIQHNKDESLEIDSNHYEFIAPHNEDPRRPIAESLLKNLPKEGSIMAYNQSFEKSCIKILAKHCPDIAKELLALNERFIDLIVPFRTGGYYHTEFGGSFSIKKVLPALCPDKKELNYDTLKIRNGGEASLGYKNLRGLCAEDISEKLIDLYEYCRLDSYAMYAIYIKLLKV